ncbi:MAG: hypothetical protein ACYCYP_10205 [Leptospirales bacterium]
MRNRRVLEIATREQSITGTYSRRPLVFSKVALALGLSFTLSLGGFGVKTALAVPSLGVATSGTYYSTGTTLTAYQSYFTSSILPDGKNGGYEGFGIGPTGSTLDVFSNVKNEAIYLLTNANVFKNNDPTFNGTSFTKFSYSSGTIPSSYSPSPYYGINLGRVGSSPWTTLPTPPFSGKNTPFYLDSGTLDYTGTIAQGNYFFAVATTLPPDSGLDVTGFSPATTGAVGADIPHAPENSTLVLMGSGLILLGWFSLGRGVLGKA